MFPGKVEPNSVNSFVYITGMSTPTGNQNSLLSLPNQVIGSSPNSVRFNVVVVTVVVVTVVEVVEVVVVCVEVFVEVVVGPVVVVDVLVVVVPLVVVDEVVLVLVVLVEVVVVVVVSQHAAPNDGGSQYLAWQ